MGQRLQLQALLVNILGSKNVYFQPPPTVKMEYPCIVYTRSDVDAKRADNGLYLHKTRYQVTVIHRDPDNAIREEVLKLPMTSFDRFYTADNLNHDVFQTYF